MNITIQSLSKIYGGNVHALNGVDLTIERGMFGLLGPNGAGKTTLMRILAGILHPTAGTVSMDGHAIRTEHDRTEVKRTLGYLPQELGVYPDLSAREFLDYVAILKGLDDAKARRSRVGELLATVSLDNVAGRKLKTYSGGMKRRVGIAQALLNDPRLLIVDEPTSGLDPEERIRFRNLLAELSEDDRTVLLSTHIVEDIAQTSRDLAVLAAGRVVFQGTIARLVSAARGHVWLVTTNGADRKPEGDFTLVAAVPLASGGMQYRCVGEPPPGRVAAESAEPTLEDGYVWLMRDQRIAPIAVS
jgi:ABC-2 type transport system ATP-binding protein